MVSENEIKMLEWPPQSLDLNLIENLWVQLERKLAGYETEPSGILELWERVDASWNKIAAELCMELMKSTPGHVSAVLKAKGGYTKY